MHNTKGNKQQAQQHVDSSQNINKLTQIHGSLLSIEGNILVTLTTLW